MHVRIATYTYRGDVRELARRAEEGILSGLRSQPGFKSYSLVESDGEVVAISAWESAAHAEAVSSVAANLVAENLGEEAELTETRVGELLVDTSLGVTTKAGATA